jgi:uncharacterized membrane protein YsdA (DUF1294 family)
MLKFLIIWNIIVFFTYGIDKQKAIRGSWRISEKALIMMAFFMGGVGAYLGMEIFRHKTKTTKFKILVPMAIVLNIAIIIYTKKAFLW